jgi:hypothetical protein
MSDWKNSRSSKIHGHPKKKTNQENEQPTMGVLPKCTQARSKFHLGEPKDIIMMKTMIPHVTKILSKLTAAAAKNCSYFRASNSVET